MSPAQLKDVIANSLISPNANAGTGTGTGTSNQTDAQKKDAGVQLAAALQNVLESVGWSATSLSRFQLPQACGKLRLSNEEALHSCITT